jgi:hypothetical protein
VASISQKFFHRQQPAIQHSHTRRQHMSNTPTTSKRSFAAFSPESQKMPDAKNVRTEEPSNAEIMTILLSLKEGQATIDAKIDSLNAEMNDLKQKFDAKVCEIESKVQVNTDKIEELRNEVERIRIERHLVVRGVPQHKDESLSGIFNSICAYLGYVNNKPYTSIRRYTNNTKTKTPQKNKSDVNFPPIFVEFSTVNDKQLFLDRYLRSADVNLQHIGMNGLSRIYIDERLTRRDQAIKKEALLMKKDKKLHSVGTRRGRVVVKWTSTSSRVPIDSIEQLTSSQQQHNDSTMQTD